MPPFPPCRPWLAPALLWLASAPLGAQTDGSPQRVEIVGTTPVPGAGIARDQVPSNVQTLGSTQLRRMQSLNLPDAMNAGMQGVTVNEIQGNPYQIDVSYRGFTASPLLGTPQGLSVFLDGVRLNEPFGDVVNWDLIPQAALAGIALLPGSNPVFGLNTLGGALTLQTKSGDTHPGTEVEVQAGSFGRLSAVVTHGRRLGESGHLFVAASGFDESGWRDASPSRVGQVFVKGGAGAGASAWDLSLGHARTRLVGNGPVPESMLAQRRSQVYTLPDITENEATLLTLNAHLDLGPTHRLAGTAYVRRATSTTLNGDLNDQYDPPTVPESGIEHHALTTQRSAGVAVQSTQRLGSHLLTLGASFDAARSRFEQSEAEGTVDSARVIVPQEDPATSALITGETRTASVYGQALVALRPDLQLTLSGRLNRTRVTTVDEGRSSLGLPTELDADARYDKFNPALGLTWQATPALTAYGSFSQGNRAPSPIELGCSDPNKACVLPNALQSDPPLEQVVSRTAEAGLRGVVDGALRWNASLYGTVNRNDLLFISNGRASGYFSNFGRTLRRGIELGLSRPGPVVDWSLSYSHLDASFEDSACIVAEGNSSAETSPACPGAGEIEVRPGDRLPGLPQHSLKLLAGWKPTQGVELGAQLRAFSDQFVRGNENNRHAPDGVTFTGSGRTGGYAVVDLTAAWKLGGGAELFGRITNLFDRDYASAGLLGRNAFDANGALLAPADWRQAQFVGPGAPRAAFVGLRLNFGD